MVKWEVITNFKKEKFPEDPDKYAEPVLIYEVQSVRTGYNKPIYLSPVKGALARLDGSSTSRHYAIDRKSDAVDIFPTGVPFNFYLELITHPKVGGIGVYLDTTGPDGLPWVMFHMDLRPRSNNRPLIWIAKKVWNVKKHALVTEYRYPQADPKQWSVFNNEKFFRDKQFSS
jgi:hypothetical protein